MDPLVSIIIVNWNAYKYLKKCIDSILKQTYRNFEIIIVDNASSDDSVEFIETNYSKLLLIKNKDNVGFAQGNNIGISHSRGEFIALFNPDAVADPEWLSNLVSILKNSEKTAATAGKIFYLGNEFGKNAVFCTWSKIDPITAFTVNFFDNEPQAEVDYLSGAAMLVKKSVIDKIGEIDPEYFLYFDETDWCARMIRAGYNLIYVPKAIAWHKVSGTVNDSLTKLYYMERSRVRFVLKNFDSKYVLLFFSFFFLETTYVLLRDFKKRHFSRSKIRLKILWWNFCNFRKTLKQRKIDLRKLQKIETYRSFNNSLPLKNVNKPK